ncbi:MAG: MFS transporter [Promethearchaeota archaeon]
MDTTPGKKLSKSEFYGYAVGFVGPITLLSLINVLLVNYYMLVVGLDPLLAGAGLSIGLAVYSVASLFFGNLSDNASGGLARKLGRRRPFMLYSIVPMALTFVLLWVPPVKPTTFWEQNWDCALWLWTFSTLFHLSFACFSPPYWALMPEISQSEDERLQLSIVQNLFNLVGTIVSVFLPIIIFSGIDTGGENLSDALFWNTGADSAGNQVISSMLLYSVLFAAITAATIGVTSATVREKPVVGGGLKQSLGTFLRDIATPLTRDRDHSFFQVANFLFNITMRIIMTYVFIFIGDVLGLQGFEWITFSAWIVGAAVLSFVFWDKLKERVGLKNSFLVCLGLSAVVLFSSAVVLVPMGRGAMVVIGTILAMMLVFVLIGILIFPNPIISVLVDKRKVSVPPEEHSKLAGKYQGINLFVMNVSNAIANLLYASAYKWLQTLNEMLTVLLLPLSGIFILAAFFVFAKSDLDVRPASGKD